MKNALKHFPELEGEELEYISKTSETLSEDQLEIFKTSYKARRKDPIVFLLLAVIGFIGFAGLHRFFAGHVGLGILYILTAGLCFIGTIVDAINYKSFSFDYNRKVAIDILNDIR